MRNIQKKKALVAAAHALAIAKKKKTDVKGKWKEKKKQVEKGWCKKEEQKTK